MYDVKSEDGEVVVFMGEEKVADLSGVPKKVLQRVGRLKRHLQRRHHKRRPSTDLRERRLAVLV